MDSDLLAEMLAAIKEQDYAIDSITVVRDGYLVLDASGYPFQPDSRHIIHSCTKSIVSILIRIAINEGCISGVDAAMKKGAKEGIRNESPRKGLWEYYSPPNPQWQQQSENLMGWLALARYLISSRLQLTL